MLKGGDVMYPNLEAELARKGWSKKKLSEILGKRYYTVIDKLNGKYPLTLMEARAIKNALNVDMSLDVLFFEK